jgi:hypothetical protein
MMCTCRLFGKNQDTQNMGHEIAFNIMSWKTVTVTNSLDQKKNLFSEGAARICLVVLRYE